MATRVKRIGRRFGASALAVGLLGVFPLATAADAVIEVAPGYDICPFVGSPENGPLNAVTPSGPSAGVQINRPIAPVVDTDGTIYFGVYNNLAHIMALRPNGELELIAGGGSDGTNASTGDNGPATAAGLSPFRQLALDATNDLLYVTADFESRVRRIDLTTGIITSVAGGGTDAGGNGIPATQAYLDVRDMVVGPDGNLSVASTVTAGSVSNNNVRVIQRTTGLIGDVFGRTGSFPGDTIASPGPWVASTTAVIPYGLAFGPSGNLYIVDYYGAVYELVPGPGGNYSAGLIDRIAGQNPGTGVTPFWGESGDGGVALGATLAVGSNQIAIDSTGRVFVTSSSQRTIRVISGGSISSIATDLAAVFEDGSASDFSTGPLAGGMVVGTVGGVESLVFSDIYNNRVRALDISGPAVGASSTLAGTGPNWSTPTLGSDALDANFATAIDVAYDRSGNAYIADREGQVILRAGVDGTLTRVAGTGEASADAAGLPLAPSPGPSTPIDAVAGLAIDNQSAQLFFFTANPVYQVGVLDLVSGEVRRYAGTGQFGSAGDGGQATAATIVPTSIGSDGLGHLFIGEVTSGKIRRVDAATGVITTIAGSGAVSPTVIPDGTPALTAGIYPSAVTATLGGDVFFTTTEEPSPGVFEYVVMMLSVTNGRLYRVAGGSTQTIPPASTSPGTTRLRALTDLYVDRDDQLYIASSGDGSDIFRIAPEGSGNLRYTNGTITSLARAGGAGLPTGVGGFGDGEASTAGTYFAIGLAVDGRQRVAMLDNYAATPYGVLGANRVRTLDGSGCGGLSVRAVGVELIMGGRNVAIADIPAQNVAAAYDDYFATPGRSGFSPGRSGFSPGRSGFSPGRSGFSPGRSGFSPGRSGFSPGRSGFSSLDGLVAYQNIRLVDMPFEHPAVPEIALSTVPIDFENGWEGLLLGTALEGRAAQDVTLRQVYALSPRPTTLADLKLGEIDLSNSPLWDISLESVAFGRAPISSIPLPGFGGNWCAAYAAANNGATCPFSNSDPLLALDARNITLPPELNGIGAGTLAGPLANTPLGTTGLDLLDLRVSRLGTIATSAAPAGTTSCAASACPTLRDAELLAAVTATNDVADLLPAAAAAQLTLNDFLIAFQNVSAIPWETLDVDTLDLAGLDTGGSAQLEISFRLYDPTPAAGVTLKVNLPPGYTTAGAPDLVVQGNQGSTTVAASSTDPLTYVIPAGTTTVPAEVGLTVPVYVGYRSDGADVSLSEVIEINGEPVRTNGDGWRVGDGDSDSGPLNPQFPSTVAIQPDVLYSRVLDGSQDQDGFIIPIPPAGSVTTISLSHLRGDADLVVYGSQTAPVLRSNAQVRTATQAPGADGALPPQLTQVGLPTSPQPSTDMALLDFPIYGYSVNRGVGDETVEIVSRGESGNYIVAVGGYNGSSSDEPYIVRYSQFRSVGTEPCTNVFPNPAGAPGATPTLDPATNTLVLVNPSRLQAEYGAAARAQVLTALGQLDGRNGVEATVVPLDAYGPVAGAYGAWDADSCSPAKANAVVLEINNVVDQLKAQLPAGQLRNIVVVGSDAQIPMARIPDDSNYANEFDHAALVTRRELAPPAQAEISNPLSAALGTRNLLTDDPYGSFTPVQDAFDRSVYYPLDVAIGRLVETPNEIVAAVTAFTGGSGTIDPTTALATGYSFFNDVPGAVAANLTGVTTQTLTGSWTLSQLSAVFPTGSADVVSLNGHADQYKLEPAVTNSSADLFRSSDLGVTSLAGRIVFSVGCHFGLSFPYLYAGVDVDLDNNGTADRAFSTGDLRGERDFAQALLANGTAAFIGNTGFGYGQDGVLAHSERLQRDLARRIDRAPTMGEAYRLAKLDFIGGGMSGARDEKSLSQFVYYGLPMWRFPAPAAAPTNGPNRATTPDPVAGGLSSSTVNLSGSALATTPQGGPNGTTFYQVGTADPLAADGQPIQPQTAPINVTATNSNLVAHGALVTSLASTDVSINAAFARSTISDASLARPVVNAETAFPTRLQNVVDTGSGADRRQTFRFVSGQFTPNGNQTATPGSGQQRLFSAANAVIYYAPASDPDFSPPAISSVSGITAAGAVQFDAVVGRDRDGSTETIARGLVLYLDGAVWRTAELSNAGDGRWTGSGAASAQIVDFFVQFVDSSGNVAVSSNKGASSRHHQRHFPTACPRCRSTQAAPQRSVSERRSPGLAS